MGTLTSNFEAIKTQPVLVLAVVYGIAMPIISAIIYPNYSHTMGVAWYEYSRLLELPFVISQVGVIIWSMRSGFSLADYWRSMPKDIKVAFLLFIVSMFISSTLFSTRPSQTILMSWIVFLQPIFGLAVYHLVKTHSWKHTIQFLKLHGWGLVLLLALTVYWWSFPPAENEVPGGVIEWASALPGFISVRHFGAWTGAIAAGFAIKILFDDNEELDQYHLWYFLAASMTVWSGTRAAILAMVVVFLIVVVATRSVPSARALGRACLLTGAALVVAYLLIPDVRAFWLYWPGDEASFRAATGGRTELWRQTFLKWIESPWLGWGTGSTFWEVYIGWPHTQPHNVVLQFLMNWGLFGAIGAFWLIGRAIKLLHGPSLADPIRLSLLAMLYALLLQSLLEGMLHYPRFIISILILIACLFALAKGDGLAKAPQTKTP
ncbi:hypothetical protein BPTFM16_01137 [Altererythrobacter insulae]|nr:hypothetical protein BPTFM16_01137 [Altererythrobacter insulae]